MDTELSNQILIMAVTSALLQLTTTCVVWLVLHVLKFYRPFWSRSLAIETDNYSVYKFHTFAPSPEP